MPAMRRPRPLACLSLALAAACAGDDDTGGIGVVAFAVPPADVGAPLTDGRAFDAGASDALGLALAQTLPVFGGGELAWETPLEAWTLLLSDLVQDEGTCPYREYDGDRTVYVADCRSSDGYEWQGELGWREWSDAVGARQRLEADIEVVADVDEPRFDRLALAGAMERVTPDDGPAVHIDVNVRLEAAGYWERRAPSDPRVEAWASWVVSGSLEQDADGAWRIDLAAEVGDGGFHLSAPALLPDDGCPIEVRGDAALGEGAVAAFEGSSSCDACARIDAGDDAVEACAP